MDPAPPSVGERFPVLISSMHQTAEEVTHTHRNAAQPGRVAVVSGGSGVESVPGGKLWGLILSWEPSVRWADCRCGGQLERQKKKEDDAAAKIQARYRGKQATVKVAVRPTDPRCLVNRVVSSRLLDLVLASSPPLVLVLVLVFMLLSLLLLFSFS